MKKVVIPQNVADAIEKLWEKTSLRNKNAVKHLALTNWNALAGFNEYSLLMDYAKNNPIEYMRALVEGYEIEFEFGKQYITKARNGEIQVAYNTNDVAAEYILYMQIENNYTGLTIEQGKEVIENLNKLIKNVERVRNAKTT